MQFEKPSIRRAFRRLSQFLAVSLALAAAGLIAPAPASAGFPVASITVYVSSKLPPCPDHFPMLLGGYALCGTDITQVTYTDGRYEIFVVGTPPSDNIFHIWQDFSGQWTSWHKLPGVGTAILGIWPVASDPLVVSVLGSDGNPYCNRQDNEWTGWYSCAGRAESAKPSNVLPLDELAKAPWAG